MPASPDSPVSRLMAEADWAATVLGARSGWVPELRTAVDSGLRSPFPVLVMWGPELATVYNDAFVPILGARHPALGRPCAQVWDDAWPEVGGMLTRVLTRGEPAYHEDLRLTLTRHGFDEEVYFTVACSPILSADGGVGGVFTVVTETTGPVLSARRMRALRELAASRSARTASAEDACLTAMRALGAHRADLPFGVTYLLDDPAGPTRPVASFGLAAPDRLPAELQGGENGDWIWQAATSGTTTTRTGLAARRPGLARPGASPAGDAEVDVAVALPLAALPGDRAEQVRARGVLVLGTTRYLRLDEDYRGFLDLVARQVAAVVTDAEAFATRKRADALADAEQPLPAAQRRRPEIIHRHSGRLRRMADLLPDFARIEDGGLTARLVPVDLAELTRGLAESFAPAVERAGLAFAVDCPPAGHPVLADPDLWELIVATLLSNAVRFTPAGVIGVSLRAGNETAELRVSDTGTGIAAEDLPRLFERFYQVRGAEGRSSEGPGIGLALVRELAALHGGEVAVASRPGAGRTLTVRIATPRAPEEAAARAGEDAAIEELAAGADDYLVKPFSPAVLLARVRSSLNLARIRNHESAWRTALIKTMQDGLFVATAEGTVIEVNDAFCDILGYPASDLPWPAPQPWWPPADTDPDGFAQATAALGALVTEGRGRFTLPLRHRDGQVVWVDLALDAVRDRDQRLIVGTLRDVTAARLAAERDAALAVTRARAYEEQRAVALALQRAILGPTDLPAGLAVHYEPASAALEVGGDWYDVIALPAGRHAVVVGDVAGHGLTAAAVMGQLRSAGRALLLESNGPARVLRALDRFGALIPGADCATVFCAVIDPHAGTVRYSSAGHPPALLVVPDGSVAVLDHVIAPALAIAGERERPEATAVLPPGSTLLLYTDGLVERRREVIDAGIARACAALAESRHLAPAAVAGHLRARLLADQHDDDVAFLVYRQPGGDSSDVQPHVQADDRAAGTGAELDQVTDLVHQP